MPAPVSSRTHCVYWPDWASSAKVELAHGMRMDANYYHYPSSWIGAKPGFLNGGGFPMRFAEQDGTLIDVYQENTNMTDEGGQAYPATVNTLARQRRSEPHGYYGAFGANMHTDNAAPHPGAEAIVAAAQARDVPVISYKQLLDWTDGRNSSTIRGLSWSAGTLTFTTTVGRRRQRPSDDAARPGPVRTLNAITSAGSPVASRRPDDQGHPVRVLHRRHRHLPGDVLLEAGGNAVGPWAQPESSRRRSAVVPPREKSTT